MRTTSLSWNRSLSLSWNRLAVRIPWNTKSVECLFVYPILANRPVSLGSGRSLASTEREDGTVVLLAHINIAAGRESSTWWLSVSTLTFEGGNIFCALRIRLVVR